MTMENKQVSEDKGNNLKYVQLRLTPDQRKTLADAAGKADRTVPDYIIHQLGLDGPALPGAAAAAAADPAVFGWINPDRNRALGQSIGHLAGWLEEAVGPVTGDASRDRAGFWAMLKIAVDRVLDHLGAEGRELTQDEKDSAELVARRSITDMKRVERDPSAYSQRPHLAVAAELARCVWVEAAFDKPTKE